MKDSSRVDKSYQWPSCLNHRAPSNPNLSLLHYRPSSSANHLQWLDGSLFCLFVGWLVDSFLVGCFLFSFFKCFLTWLILDLEV